jgi:hypothetical protein
MKNITISSIDASGVIFSRGVGKERETAEVSWESLYELAGTSGGCGAPDYPHMMPKGPFADLVREAMAMARNLKKRIISVSPHPYNQVRVETVAGEYVGQEMGGDWCVAQHAFPSQAEKEARELTTLYAKRKFQVIRNP